MIDLNHYIGSDLAVGPTGDLAYTSGTQLGQQRVVRRLITNPGAYIWELDYGGGVGLMVGEPANVNAIRGIIRGQISKEAAVAPDPVANIDVQSTVTGIVTATIQYADADTGDNQVLTLPIGT